MPVEEGELPLPALAVAAEQDVTACSGSGATPQEPQPDSAVPRVAESLRGNDADVGFAVGHEAAHTRELGLHGDTQVAMVASQPRIEYVIAPPACQRPAQAADPAVSCWRGAATPAPPDVGERAIIPIG